MSEEILNPEIKTNDTDDIQKWKNEQWKKITQGKRTFSEVSLDENFIRARRKSL